MIKDLGRNTNETNVTVDEKVDAKILGEIMVSGDEIEDAADAGYVLDQISTVEVLDSRRESSEIRVFLKVLGGITFEDGKGNTVAKAIQLPVEHLLRIPSQRQINEYRRSNSRIIQLPHNVRELRLIMDPAGPLYDALKSETLGYAPGSAIPLSHKYQVVSELLAALDREMSGEAIDPENF